MRVSWPTAGLLLTLGIYAMYYGAILWMSDGIPYVMDGNETFSSLWHARNLVEHGFALTAGLADEVFSPHAAAHPFVHTHQGNFPRVFATLIYFLGARSPESQIVITTLLIGGASVAMMYRLLARVVAPAFAMLACLLLFTDYVLYAQWQVVTYRVWHGFFFFSSLLLARGAGGPRRGTVALLTFLNTLCLFYWELVFAAFAATTAGLYAGWTHRRSLRAVLWAWVPQVGGAVLAVVLLVWQLSAYMGWDAAMGDLRATFLARNHQGSTEALLANLQAFYNSRRVIFWPNFEDGSVYLDLAHFVASIGYYELQIWTPFLSLASIVLLLGGLSAVRWAGKGSRATERPVDTVVIRILFSYPCLIAAFILAVHLGHRSLRGDLGILAVLATGVVAAAVVILAAIIFALETLPGGRARLETVLRRGPSLLATLILGAILPSVINHMSIEPILLDRYSVLFSVFVVLYGATFGAFALMAWRSWMPGDDALGGLYVPRWLRSQGSAADAALAMLAGALTWVCIVALSDEFVPLGIQDDTFGDVLDLDWRPVLVAGLAGLAALRAGRYIAPGTRLRRKVAGGTLARYASWMAAAVTVLLGGGFLFNQNHRQMWLTLHEATLDTGAARVALLGVLGFGAWLAVARRGSAVSAAALARLSAVWPIVFAALGAYMVVYRLSPGYVFSGYRFRLAPFTVYATCLVLAAAWYPVLLAVRHGMRKLGRARRLGILRRSRGSAAAHGARPARWWRMGGPILACAVGLSFAGYWAALQVAYIRMFPPDYFGPLFTLLQRPPYAGRSMVLDGYPGAPAWFTGEWAYMDFKLPLAERDAEGRLRRDDGMMWLADRATNPEYRRPDYYLCMNIQTLTSASMEISERRLGTQGVGGCEAREIVRLARSARPSDQDPALELAEFDTAGLSSVGYARWALVRLRWQGGR
jgi:hypothetical protein